MITTYAIYVVVSLAITVWVGRTLSRNGRLFLVENFNGNEALADSINHLLLVGFYLDGRLLLDEMVSQVYDLADIAQGLDDMHAGKLNRGVLAVPPA